MLYVSGRGQARAVMEGCRRKSCGLPLIGERFVDVQVSDSQLFWNSEFLKARPPGLLNTVRRKFFSKHLTYAYHYRITFQVKVKIKQFNMIHPVVLYQYIIIKVHQ